MNENTSQKTIRLSTAVLLFVIFLLIGAVIAGVAMYYVPLNPLQYDKTTQENNVVTVVNSSSSNTVANTAKSNTSVSADTTKKVLFIPTGWKQYTNSNFKLTFSYPKDWYLTTSETRISLSNHSDDEDINISNVPKGFQGLWISKDPSAYDGFYEYLKNAPNKPFLAETVVTPSGIKIDVYRHIVEGGGSKMDALWKANDLKYSAAISTNIGVENQLNEIGTLSRLLDTLDAL